MKAISCRKSASDSMLLHSYTNVCCMLTVSTVTRHSDQRTTGLKITRLQSPPLIEEVEEDEEGHVFILGFRPCVPLVVEEAVSDVGDRYKLEPEYTPLSRRSADDDAALLDARTEIKNVMFYRSIKAAKICLYNKNGSAGPESALLWF